MVVTGACIKVDVYLAITDCLDEFVLVKSREFKYIVIKKVFFAIFPFTLSFDISTDIKTIL